MAAVNFELRGYQTDALDSLRSYLGKVPSMGAGTAFYDVAKRPFTPAPLIDPETPYVCIRIPTGGGKTIVAAHAIGVAAQTYLQTPNPMVLWLVPSTAILDQTLAALRNLDHPYRAALATDFGHNLSVLTVAEALSLSRPDATGGACIIVSTIQAFRVEDKTGRKVYQDAGALMDHFSGLTDEQTARLEKVEGTNRPTASLANVLRLHRPMVIVDEAHNARTDLSFDALQGFDPSLILELTATPQLTSDPAKGLVPSNVLYHVSAASLKAAEMIKLPIRLETEADWKKVVGGALDCREALEKVAKAEEADTGEYIRPIILFQAQSESKTDPHRLTPEVVVEHLVTDKGISRDQIAIHAKSFKELDDIDDIEATDCPIRYVVTVQKLREGWDCPFAYVLCSVAQLESPTAVEQILGRVLRMPNARRKTRDELNRAYAFVASNSFNDVALKLKDGLVDGAGFDRLEADELVKAHQGFIFAEETPGYVHESDPLPDAPSAKPVDVLNALEKLPASLRARVTFDPAKRTLGIERPMARDERNRMMLSFAKVDGAPELIERLFIKSNRIQASETPTGTKPPFLMPQLGFMRQGELELFGTDHFLSLPWNLADCDANAFADAFTITDAAKTGELDVSEDGKTFIDFVGTLHTQLSMIVHEPAWTLPRLVNWIDKGIPHRDITKPAARLFILNALEASMKKRGYSLDEMVRYKYEARRKMADVIDTLRKSRQDDSYGALFAAEADKFATSADLSIVFDEQSYDYNEPYKGPRRFRKHYFPIIGDLKPRGEEFDCATYLDEHDKVAYWLRNVDRKPNSFWLQLPSGKFYPDFVALLTDGRKMAVEYKGKHLEAESKPKRDIGELWAEASGGDCVFAMPVNNDLKAIDAAINA
jgi:type III restriction enzyme